MKLTSEQRLYHQAPLFCDLEDFIC